MGTIRNKERVILLEKMKVTLQKKRNKLNYICFEVSPFTEIFEIRKQAQALISEQSGKKLIDELTILAKREKEMLKIAKQQQNSGKLISELCNIDYEISALTSELFYLKRENEKSYS